MSLVRVSGGGHDHFSMDPPLPEQLDRMAANLKPVAAAALERGLTLGLLPHLDYRSTDLLQVMHAVNSPALRMAFDTTNSFPTAEDPVDAARNLLPYAVDIALKVGIPTRPHLRSKYAVVTINSNAA